MRMCFCFVLLSLALFYLSPVMFLSAATCITLSSYFCRYFIIFYFFYYSPTHVRLRTHADAHLRGCFYYYYYPSTYSTYVGLCCFLFSYGVAFYAYASAYLHSCQYAHAYVSLFLSCNWRTRFTPCGPCCLYFVLCTYFSSLFLGRACKFHVLSPFSVFFSVFCCVTVFRKFLAKVENRKTKDYEQAV